MNASDVATVYFSMLHYFRSGYVIFLLYICLLNQVNTLVYDDLRTLNASCYPRDSCHRSQHLPRPTEEGDTCECDATCYRRGTCCVDSEYVDPRPSTRSEICSGERIIGVSHNYYFSNTESFTFFQVTQCDRRWDSPLQVRELCEMEEPIDGVDIMVAIPVTNINSGITYKNYYCALCNNDIKDSVLWDVGIYERDYKALISDRFDVQATDDVIDDVEGSSSCSEGITAPLLYNEDQGYYGYWDYCSYNVPYFVWVTVTLTVPEQIQHLVKGCRSNLISRCSLGWTNVRIRILCGSYLGIIKGPPQVDEFGTLNQQYFRNAHCAQCNNVTSFEDYSCETLSVGDIISNTTYPTSVTIRFEHLLSNNGCLGNYEQNFEGLGCRAVVCANPQYKMVNGRCTPS